MNVKKDRANVRSKYIMVLMTPKEKKKAQRAANDVGITLSALVRMAIADYLKKSNN